MTSVGVTFEVATVPVEEVYIRTSTVRELAQTIADQAGGKVLKTTEPEGTIEPALKNGFVGAAFQAYNQHMNLVLSPDDVWVAITTAFANYVDRHAEEMRHHFVTHKGKKELVVYSVGSITTANYDDLINQMSNKIDENTKAETRKWLESDFSTTTSISRTVSKVVLMGAMKNYFSYKMCLMCGLPSVTLLGTLQDWQEIRTRVDRLSSYGVTELNTWAEVLGHVIDEFVSAYQGKVDKDFWNRITHESGGGSGPTYLEGWILAFMPWTDEGKFILSPLSHVLSTHSYGFMDTNDVPASAVEVPVIINDNGTEYQTIFYAGAIAATYDASKNRIKPSLDWGFIDVTK
eukprot:TRINITY_DN1286_c0_g1_i5.p1 TRINITY_DN1286_c0_g1~~TRINITY_DN1286_c0_g1_i5.p1  ORF type:complete len:365 (-),score=80.48 TRINITY_DN1286_c0_g1_i5:139-1179(-)